MDYSNSDGVLAGLLDRRDLIPPDPQVGDPSMTSEVAASPMAEIPPETLPEDLINMLGLSAPQTPPAAPGLLPGGGMGAPGVGPDPLAAVASIPGVPPPPAGVGGSPSLSPGSAGGAPPPPPPPTGAGPVPPPTPPGVGEDQVAAARRRAAGRISAAPQFGGR